MVQMQSPQEAYAKGYADGLRMAEQMRWQGTPIGNILKGSCYNPDRYFHAEYNDGFKHAMDAACRVEWSFPAEEATSDHLRTVGPKRWLSAA